jgi:hypothetical protein
MNAIPPELAGVLFYASLAVANLAIFAVLKRGRAREERESKAAQSTLGHTVDPASRSPGTDVSWAMTERLLAFVCYGGLTVVDILVLLGTLSDTRHVA